jgi:mannosidase alpha-like ER degradation enhancer 1
MINGKEEFLQAVNDTISSVSFDINCRVQVFETNIRILGALLSAHLLLRNPKSPYYTDVGYQDELLGMAYDLGKRLLPAFVISNTGIPYPRVATHIGELLMPSDS